MEDKQAENMVGVRRLKLAAEAALDQGRDSHAHKFLMDALHMLGNRYEVPGAVDDTRLGVLAAQDLAQRGRVREAASWLMTVLTTRLRLLEPGRQEAVTRCRTCGASNPQGRTLCGTCGSPIGGENDVHAASPATRACRRCGRAVRQGKKFCPWCGASQG
jgi:RNA polymerase subunit RPABC4/transcription elongation factor Spt4